MSDEGRVEATRPIGPRYGTRAYRLEALKRRMDEMLHGHGDEPTASDVLSILRDVVEEL